MSLGVQKTAKSLRGYGWALSISKSTTNVDEDLLCARLCPMGLGWVCEQKALAFTCSQSRGAAHLATHSPQSSLSPPSVPSAWGQTALKSLHLQNTRWCPAYRAAHTEEQGLQPHQPISGTQTHPNGFGSGPGWGCPLTAHLETRDTSPKIQWVRNTRLPKAAPANNQSREEATALAASPFFFRWGLQQAPSRIKNRKGSVTQKFTLYISRL